MNAMSSKTPRFDEALGKILADVVPHERTCGRCREPFSILKEDIDFYRMLRFPLPAHCPLCRKKRRMGHLMRLPRFFKKKCFAPGHSEEVITVFLKNLGRRMRCPILLFF